MRLFRIAVFMFAFCGALFYVLSLIHFQSTLDATQQQQQQHYKKHWLATPRAPRNLSESNQAIPNKKSLRQKHKEQQLAANEKRAHKKQKRKAARGHHEPEAKAKEAAVTKDKLETVHDANQKDEMGKVEITDTATEVKGFNKTHRAETKKVPKDLVEASPEVHIHNPALNETGSVVANETATLVHSKAISHEANDTVLEKKLVEDQTSNKTLVTSNETNKTLVISNETNKTLQTPRREQSVTGINNDQKKAQPRGNQKIQARPKRRRQKDAKKEDESPLPQQLNPVPDPLAHTPKKGSVKSLPFSPKVPYLGVLVDAGRQYYSIDWLMRLIDYLHHMRFNLIHFRLTDDQAFNIRLDSHPEFAKASAVSANGTVYTPLQLRELVAYAQERNITIMPEINVPGHAGAWHGIPNMLVPCANFICEKGYGIPLNVEHPQLFSILKDILTEIKDIFYTSPFFHFGGDEVHMSMPCFREAGVEMYDYDKFERKLSKVVTEVGVKDAIRWEMTGQKGPTVRVVSIEHYWLSRNYAKDANGTAYPFFSSQGLYFDSNEQKDGFFIYERTREYLTEESQPTAIIAGTFELGMDTWLDRNIMGRLLAVAMGASGVDFTVAKQAPIVVNETAALNQTFVNGTTHNLTSTVNKTAEKATAVVENAEDDDEDDDDDEKTTFAKQYLELCKSLSFDDNLCLLLGRPSVIEEKYKERWNSHWDFWKKDICEKLTVEQSSRSLVSSSSEQNQNDAYSEASEMFWESFMVRFDSEYSEEQYDAEKWNLTRSPNGSKPLIHDFSVPYRGISLDLVRSLPGNNATKSLMLIVDTMSELGLNLLQLRIMDDLGFVFQFNDRLDLQRVDNGFNGYDSVVPVIVAYAYERGIMVMPEISITTHSGGWSDSFTHVKCPNTLCEDGRGAIDLAQPSAWPILSITLKMLRYLFSSKFIHLGYDERKESMACFEEAAVNPEFNVYEEKMREILHIERIPLDHVLRWENQEREVYANRTGAVTHYRVSDGPTINNASSPWFVSTDLYLDEEESTKLDGWGIYKHTRSLAEKSPTGILASVGVLDAKSWKALNIKGRLLAMSLGLSKTVVNSETGFRKIYNRTCFSLNSRSYECEKMGTLNVTSSWWTAKRNASQLWVDQACKLRTKVIIERIPKKGVLVE